MTDDEYMEQDYEKLQAKLIERNYQCIEQNERIAKLEKENKELHESLEKEVANHVDVMHSLLVKNAKLEAENGQLKEELAEKRLATVLNARFEKALRDIRDLDDINPDNLNRDYGFLGWTCCGKKSEIAEKALGDK